ncbi:TonB-dependent receptor [Luteimonas sp. e5]
MEMNAVFQYRLRPGRHWAPRHRPLVLALVAALTAATLPADAQEAGHSPDGGANELDAVVVTGSRLQAREEIESRRESLAIVDSLSADDIGEMPDLTIGESLRRITGVTTIYNDDIGQFASIRGSHPDYVPVTINGLTIATTGDHGEGTRKVNMQVIPSSAVRQLRAFKSLSPELDAGALAGLIDIVPSAAFDPGQRLFSASTGTSYSTYMDVPDVNSWGRDGKSAPWGRTARFSWAPGFAGDTIGLLVTGIYEQRPRTQSNNTIENYLYYDDAGRLTTPESPDWNGYAAPNSFVAHNYTNVFTKHGGTVRLDWHPGNGFKASLFGFAYLSDEQETRNTNRVFNLNQHRDQTATTGTANISAADTQWRYNDFNRDQMGLQAQAEWDWQERGQLNAQLGRSKAWYRSDRPFSAFRYAPNSRLSYDLSNRHQRFVPDDRMALLDPENYSNFNVYKDRREAHSYVTEAKVDYGLNHLADSRGWGFSAGMSRRTWNMRRDNTATQYERGQLDLGDLAFVTDFNPPGHGSPVLWQDGGRFWDTVAPGMTVDEKTSAYNSLANDYNYRESVFAGYVNGIYAADDFRVSGGLRFDRTSFDAEMAAVANGVVLPEKAAASGTQSEVLPYLNVVWSVSPEFRIKASASRTLGRPNPEMIATVENMNHDDLTGTRGNPLIRPRKSNNFDLGLEYYFNGGLGMALLTGFYKGVTDDILNVSWQEVINGDTWTIRAPVNGEDTTYKGIELSVVNTSFVNFHPSLEPLGMALNVMFVDGASSYLYRDVSTRIDRLQYQSRYAGNAALFWSFKGGSELRLAANFQGKYLESFAATPWQNIWIKPFSTVDLTMKWWVNPSLQLGLRGRNIFSQRRARLTGPDKDLIRADMEVGSTWFLDLHYRF